MILIRDFFFSVFTPRAMWLQMFSTCVPYAADGACLLLESPVLALGCFELCEGA